MSPLVEELLTEIGGVGALNIPRIGTADSDWNCRVVYSVLGKMALASLYDVEDEGSAMGNTDVGVSIQHFKGRIKEIWQAYTAIVPNLEEKLPFTLNDSRGKTMTLDEKLYAIYRDAGCFYHKSNRIVSARESVGRAGNFRFIRGAPVGNTYWMSGLGFYGPFGDAAPYASVAEAFGLPGRTLTGFLSDIERDGSWRETNLPETAEFLRMDGNLKSGYWMNRPERYGRDGRMPISLFRYGTAEKIYALYRYEDGVCQSLPIPPWRFLLYSPSKENKTEWLRVAAAILLRRGVLPPIEAAVEEKYVTVRLGYLLPPAEEAFFCLYSWPKNFEIGRSCLFERVFRASVYPFWREMLETLGYCFKEN